MGVSVKLQHCQPARKTTSSMEIEDGGNPLLAKSGVVVCRTVFFILELRKDMAIILEMAKCKSTYCFLDNAPSHRLNLQLWVQMLPSYGIIRRQVLSD